MGEEISALVPNCLTSDGSGVVGFTIEIERDAYSSCERRFRIEGVPEVEGARLSGRFGPLPVVNPSFPGAFSGDALVVIEVFDRRLGTWLAGWFTLRVHKRNTQSFVVNVGGHSASDTVTIYQPVEVHAPDGGSVDSVGERTRVTVPLKADRPRDAVPLEHLLEREPVLVLPQVGSAPARVLQFHVGERLVVGRCYASQLIGPAATKLAELGCKRVHWVTGWDDIHLHRLSVLVRHTVQSGSEFAQLQNITHFTGRGSMLRVESLEETHQVPPGEMVDLPVANESVVTVSVGEHTDRRQVVRFSFEEVSVGENGNEVPVPLYRTEQTSFRWPPEGGADSLMVHHLGFWVPWSARKMAAVLRTSGQPLNALYPRDQVSLYLRYDPDSRGIVVSSNENLRRCLSEG